VKSRHARTASFAAAAAAAAALGVAAWLHLDERRRAAPEIAGYVLPASRELPAIELVDEQGAPFRSADFRGGWSFLYFGYTYCPDVCPLTLVELAAVKRQLAAGSFAESTTFYLVSVDPRRDTPARLREYVAYFDTELRGLTGTPETLAAFAAATETLFEVPQEPSGDNYLVSHSSNVVLLDPEGRFHAVFTPPHEPAALAADFAEVVTRYNALR
jgi:protein SCO1/2